MLKIHLRVKFRAFFITFFTLDNMFPVPIPVAIPLMAERTLYSDHGVYLGFLVD